MKIRRYVTKTNGEVGLESMQSYNRRATMIITNGFRRAGAKPLHEKLLQATFKDAWRLGVESRTGLDIFRQIRSREWWGAVNSYPAAKRQKGSTKHRRSRGPTTSWEDPLVCGIGLDWRTIRANCGTKAEWKATSLEAIKTILSKWKLPEVNKKPAAGERIITEEPKPKVPRLQLLQKWRVEDEIWVKPNYSILIVADNQAMAEIVNGRLKYQRGDDEPRKLLHESTSNICRIMDLGWSAKDSSYDMVQWRGRKWNTVADKLANDAMNEGKGHLSWTDRWP